MVQDLDGPRPFPRGGRGITWRTDFRNQTPGSCASCGFLANQSTDPAYPMSEEVPSGQRWSGEGFDKLRTNHPSRVACYINKAQLDIDAITLYPQEADSPEGRGTAVKRVLDFDRRCRYWFSWQDGFSPKEHVEWQRMLELEQRRAESEERIAAQNARIQEAGLEITRQLAASEASNAASLATSERIQVRALGVAEESHSHNRRWTIVFVIFAIASFVAQAFYPGGIDGPKTVEWLRSLLP
ncbi:hypothetical protein BH20CHL5_BH20CHL5_05290 [soil metagenome]